MTEEANKVILSPPEPIVKVPMLIKHGGVPPKEYKKARGYSVPEISELGLSIREARKLGIYVDERRKTKYEENVKALREWLEKVRKGEILPPEPTLPKKMVVKRKKGRVFRGLTKAGRKVRGLVSIKLRYTHRYKWKRKQKERELKKRHEGKRSKGGH